MNIDSIGFEIALIVGLILLNGFFAGAEIAVVSSRRSRLDAMAKEKKKGALIVQDWLISPGVFLATVQIGITLVGVLASVVGGATAIEFLKPRLEAISGMEEWAEPLAMGIVVVLITYFSLVLGELVPKSLALAHRERLAVLVALPIHALSKIAHPFVRVLTLSTQAALRVFGQKEIPKELFVSEEEIRFLLKEGATQGVFDQTEQQLIPKVFDFSVLKVRDVMVPVHRISALDVSTPREQLLRKVSEEGFTRLPVYRGDVNNIVGILHMKDLIHAITLGQLIVLEDLLRAAVFLDETSAAKDLLAAFQQRRQHMAIVRDAAGRTLGLVTLEDLLERIVGDIKDEHDF